MYELARAVNPASILVPPMHSAMSPTSAMSERRPQDAAYQSQWTQISGSATEAYAAPDGSIYALSDQSAYGGSDRYIWRYVNGQWFNLPGSAVRLAVGRDGKLWAVNSAGGIYFYQNNTWIGIAGGANDITVGSDGQPYVISNTACNSYGCAIFKYTGSTWNELPGWAARVFANPDSKSYAYNGSVISGGVYVINRQNQIFVYNPSINVWLSIAGGASPWLAPTENGGIFALGTSLTAAGTRPIFYFDFITDTWTEFSGAASAISTDSVNLLAIGGEATEFSIQA